MQNYFTKILEDHLKAVIKPQYVDQLPRAIKGTVNNILKERNESTNLDEIINQFDLKDVMDREVENLSGGELQRFACAVTCIRKSDIYMFDEPSSYLDVKQRLKAALAIRSLIQENRYRQVSYLYNICKSNYSFSSFLIKQLKDT